MLIGFLACALLKADLAMICITTHTLPSHTMVTIEGQLTAADLPAIRRVRRSVHGVVALNLCELSVCAREGIDLLQDWLDSSARLDAATPFLRMALQDRKAWDSPVEPPIAPDLNSSSSSS